MAGNCLAPAKVNLFLHVGAPSEDGFHPICSAMVFADVGDLVSLDPRPGLTLSGPFSPGLDAGSDNLVTRAMGALGDHLPKGAGLHLEKRLPIAAGLGGGSSDAGAALRLLRSTYAPEMSDTVLEALAASLGSDGAACLWAKSVLAQGRGERLSPWDLPPDLHGVLVNPRVAVSTAGVYRKYDEMAVFSDTAPPARPDLFVDAEALARWLTKTRNDLQSPALAMEPVISDVLDVLESGPGVLLARMSGSGATCFALCSDRRRAEILASRVSQGHPDWWVQACSFN
ncbi:MAG: 4-(cytidine 5'-diphospho)-2-C-methyl-D-erythritol kinase [Alphaproteobacteria bacterium PA2]|nr:MAG: 4-(cytidine 5'-diphospho)-2-C-methyl-D-erythritol kinase [Alphaproteobacteria bacterium PA2]